LKYGACFKACFAREAFPPNDPAAKQKLAARFPLPKPLNPETGDNPDNPHNMAD
jgi:hypothetical protein